MPGFVLNGGDWLCWFGRANKQMMRTLGVIPARGGSKDIPRKNLYPLGGKPLICYTIEAARQARQIDRLIVSTDDLEIARVAEATGAEVPFLRPAHLASDTASQLEVAIHAVSQIESGGSSVETVILLQPTTPFRSSQDIDQALELLQDSGADSVMSLYQVHQDHPYYMYTLEDGRPKPLLSVPIEAINRQQFPSVYVRNGAIYAVRRHILMERRSLYGANIRAYIMPFFRSISINSEIDLALAEFLLAAHPQAVKG